MQRFWDPLYRCTPLEIIPYLPSLMLALRNVFKTSRYFNISVCVASFLVKTTNQLTIASKIFLTNQYTVSIFRQEPVIVIEKIAVSLDAVKMLRSDGNLSPLLFRHPSVRSA